LHIIERKIKDQNVIWLIKVILNNHKTDVPGKGMPIGNLTSQFFANVYLNELDRFIKHGIRAKYYLRYVDDFVILHTDRKELAAWQREIQSFLAEQLKVELHPEKSRIISSRRGVTLLGFRIFGDHRLLKKSNSRRIWKRLDAMKQKYDRGLLTKAEASASLEGWMAYAAFAKTHKLRARISSEFSELFP